MATAKKSSATKKAAPAKRPIPSGKKVWEYIKKNDLKDKAKRA